MFRRRESKREKTNICQGQVSVEFFFCFLVVCLMIWSLTYIMMWNGRDLTNRRRAHDRTLTGDGLRNYSDVKEGPLQQIDPYFYSAEPMNAIWLGR